MQKNKGGRPSDYRPEYCDEILKFFSRELYSTQTKQVASQGQVVEISETVANALPTFQKFAAQIGTTNKTMLEWCKVNDEFRKAYAVCKELQYDFLVHHGLLGGYKSAFAKFLATNVTDLRDRTEHQIKDSTIRIEKSDEDL